jgi:hypothetical protein
LTVGGVVRSGGKEQRAPFGIGLSSDGETAADAMLSFRARKRWPWALCGIEARRGGGAGRAMHIEEVEAGPYRVVKRNG